MMGVTRGRDLAAGVVGAALVSYLTLHVLYRYFPPVTVWTGLSLLALAVGEAAWGVSIRGRIREGKIGVGAGRLNPLAVARAVAIAKASAWVGALSSGWWMGALAYLVPKRSELRVAVADTPGSAVAAFSALALIAAALWLQSSCRSPGDPDVSADGFRD